MGKKTKEEIKEELYNKYISFQEKVKKNLFNYYYKKIEEDPSDYDIEARYTGNSDCGGDDYEYSEDDIENLAENLADSDMIDFNMDIIFSKDFGEQTTDYLILKEYN